MTDFILSPAHLKVGRKELPLTLNYRTSTGRNSGEELAKKIVLVQHDSNPEGLKVKGNSLTIPKDAPAGHYRFQATLPGKVSNYASIYLD